MATANVNDRTTIERLYPREAFARDAGRNADPKATAQHGLRIESEPDGTGAFALSPASRALVEEDMGLHSLFLAPTRSYDAALEPGGAAYGGTAERRDGPAAERSAAQRAYESFIDRVLEAARSVRFQELDPQDERLKGFHGG